MSAVLFCSRSALDSLCHSNSINYSDVTSDQSVITLNVYDRTEDEQIFLGMVEIKPVLKHDHTVDHWYK